MIPQIKNYEQVGKTKTVHNSKMSYAGTDIKVYASINISQIKNFKSESSSVVTESNTGSTSLIELGEVQTISYSVYRDKSAAKGLGSNSALGFTRGQALIAGTVIFTVFHDRVLWELNNLNFIDSTNPEDIFSNMRIDQLPPLDVFITFGNEMGDNSRMGIFGIEFINEGQVMSVADLITENSVNYVARHLSPMRSVEGVDPDSLDASISERFKGDPIGEADYKKARNEINLIKNYWI